jgi:uncharacterized protein (DUF2252 family)
MLKRPARVRDIVIEPGTRFATLEERMEAGKALRKRVPRASHALWAPGRARRDPIELLDEQNKTRVAALVPIRWGRMLASPFTFMRGSALVMATDLSTTPNTGIRVQACGDCHMLNFGAYATPERNIVFDMNDFDETLPAPWEWDVKRLAASIEHAGRDLDMPGAARETAVREMSSNYRSYMAKFAEITALQVWYLRLDTATIGKRFARTAASRKRMAANIKRAQKRTMESAFIKMTSIVNGQRRFVDNPPEIFHPKVRSEGHPLFNEIFGKYLGTIRDDLRVLLSRYRAVDFVFKVVGVGSVGKRCGVMLMMANDGDALLLQIKEANPSVLDVYAGKSKYQNHGQRVVAGQRLMQASSDIFLGWTSLRGRDYYVRQLRDMKWAPDPSTFSRQQLNEIAAGCGATLARAHARSTDPALISGYLGRKGTFDDAMVEFARLYADQGERDFELLEAAVKKRRIKATRDSASALANATKKALLGASKAFE